MKKSLFKTLKLALCVLFIFGFAMNIPNSAGAAPSDSSGIDYKDEYFFRWTKVLGSGNVVDYLGKDPDKPKPIIIVESHYNYNLLSPMASITPDNAGEISYVANKSKYSYRYFNDNGEFISDNAYDSFFAKYAGIDTYGAPKYHFLYPSYEKKAPTYKAYLEPSVSAMSGNSDDRDTFLAVQNINSNERKEAWSITNDNPSHLVPYGKVKIYNPLSGIAYDQRMSYYYYSDGTGAFGSRYYNPSGSWDSFDNFTLYVGNKISYASINWDHTVQSGQVLNCKDNLMVTNNASITIEKGAVLSVSGQFFNNGTIINRGTLVLQDNSCINSLESTNGSIINDGGDIVMLKGSKLYVDSNAKLTLKNGSTLVNAGMLIVQFKFEMSDSTLDIRENGSVFFGYKVADSSRSQLKTVPVQIVDSNYTGPTGANKPVKRPQFDGLAGYLSYSSYDSDVFQGYDANRFVNNARMIMSGNVEIINSGYMEVNEVMVSLDNKVNYTERKNGVVSIIPSISFMDAKIEEARYNQNSLGFANRLASNLLTRKFWVNAR